MNQFNNSNNRFPPSNSNQNNVGNQPYQQNNMGNGNFQNMPNQFPQGQMPPQMPNQQQQQVPNPNHYQNQNHFQNQQQQTFQQQNKNQMPDNFLQNPHNRQGYNAIEQNSMQDFYEYKKSRKKLYVMMGFLFILFVFILGLFTTPFINGTPTLLNEEKRQVLSYSDTIKNKTERYFSNDDDYFSLGIDIGMKTVSSSVNMDNNLSSEIYGMEKFAEDLKNMEKSKSVPASFAGTNGLHQKMIGLLELRSKRLNDLRILAQGQNLDLKKFTQEFTSYIEIRNEVVSQYNNKYESNFNKSLYNMKELEFNVQTKK